MRARAVIVAVLLVCTLAGLWMYTGGEPSSGLVGRSNVVGGLAGLAALVVAVVLLWPRAGSRRRAAAAAVTVEQADAALAYLAGETLRYWRGQAKARRITTPSPAAVRWRWAPTAIAVPAEELRAPVNVSGGPVLLPHTPAQVLTAGVVTRLREDLYQRLGPGARMVLLGDAGAGKTAAMLLLLIDILEHRPPGSDEPVPVWLTLGGWDPNTTGPLEYAAGVLGRDYPGLAAPEHGGTGAAAHLLRAGRVALFLDGLDEMGADLRGAALTAIDRDSDGLRVVLTSRPEEYAAAVGAGRLYGAAVVELLRVGVEQAEEFLLAEQLGEKRSAWQQVIADMRANTDGVAAQTLATPLALSLGRDVYAIGGTGHLPTAMLNPQEFPTSEALLRHLLTRSLILAYPDQRQRRHAVRWLSWIAARMGGRDLRWWDIPTWAPCPHRLMIGALWAFGVGVGVIDALEVVGPPAELGVGGGLWVAVALTLGVVYGMALSASLGREAGRTPQRLDVRPPTRREVRRLVVVGVGVGLTIGVVFLYIFLRVSIEDFGYRFRGNPWPLVGLVCGLLLGSAIGVMLGLVGLWSRPAATAEAADPPKIYRSDLQRSLVVTFELGVLFALAFVIAFTLGPGLVWAVGCILGLVYGLSSGLGPAMRVSLLQAAWQARGRRVQFMSLLKEAQDRQVLRQAGTVYQFRHAAMQDLLAADPLPPELAALGPR